jgi:GalNAc-alpha-(1->4)-GalNAc-alpha-(1->3)-diNAcBac-PP-undecaprenol alpha-1,4-N-acetyl-D-galactosaminyltransferase
LKSKKPVKIVFIIPSLQSGGMERVMSQLLFYFSKHSNCELHLILYGISRDVFYDIPTNVVLHQPNFKFNNNLRLWSTFKTLFYIRKTFKKIKPYSILSFGEYWNNFVLLASLGLSLPVYVSDRSQPNKSLGKLHDKLRRILYPKAKGVICQTEKAFYIYQKMFKHHNFIIIGNPIKDVVKPNIHNKENIVLSVGRLIDSKHHEELIKMFADINQENWKLIIVGDNALKQNNREKLQKLIHELGMEHKIELAGRQSNVDHYYNKSKIFAFTSSSEGFPNVLGEAMSAGLPIVAYDCVAGPSELILENETGYLVPLHSKEQFKLKLKRLLENDNLRIEMGHKAKESIKKNSLEVIGLKFKEAMFNGKSEEILNQRKAQTNEPQKYLDRQILIKTYIKEKFKSSPFLYIMWFKLNKGKLFNFIKLPDPSHNYYFDGYPRSGNTFIHNYIKHLLPEFNGASHLHCIAGIKIAFKYKLPVIVVIREPFDAITSNLFMIYGDKKQISNELMDEVIIEYIVFYKYVLAHKKDMHIIVFNDFFNVLINTSLGILDFLKVDTMSDSVLNSKYKEHLQIMKLKEKDKSDQSSSMPNKRRIKFKQTLTDRINTNSNLKEALILYGIIKNEECVN